IVVALFVWFYHEAIREGQEWTTTIVSLPAASARTALRAEALRQAAFLRMALGPEREPPGVRSQLEESAAICRELGDDRRLGMALSQLGQLPAHGRPGDVELLTEAVELLRAAGDPASLAFGLHWLATGVRIEGDSTRAHEAFSEAAALRRSLGLWDTLAMSLRNLCLIAWLAGDYDTARTYLEESLVHLRATGGQWVERTLGDLGFLGLLQADGRRAEPCFRESIQLASRNHN